MIIWLQQKLSIKEIHMSYQSAYLDLEIKANKRPEQIIGEFQITLEIKLKELLKGLFHAFITGPQLVRKDGPHNYSDVAGRFNGHLL